MSFGHFVFFPILLEWCAWCSSGAPILQHQPTISNYGESRKKNKKQFSRSVHINSSAGRAHSCNVVGTLSMHEYFKCTGICFILCFSRNSDKLCNFMWRTSVLFHTHTQHERAATTLHLRTLQAESCTEKLTPSRCAITSRLYRILPCSFNGTAMRHRTSVTSAATV